MFSFHTALLLFLFTLIAIVGSTNGGCDEDALSEARQKMADEQARASAEAGDRINRLILSCETTGTGTGGSSGNSGLATIIELFVGLFFLILIAIVIWIVCVRRQKAMNAAAIINPYPGEMGAKEMGNGVDEKTKTVAMSTTTGKPSNGDNNV